MSNRIPRTLASDQSDLPTLIRRRASFSQRPSTSSTTSDSIAYTHDGRSPTVGYGSALGMGMGLAVGERSPLMDVYEPDGILDRGTGGGYPGSPREEIRFETGGISSGMSSPSLYSPRAPQLHRFGSDPPPAWGAMAGRSPSPAVISQSARSTSSRSATPTPGMFGPPRDQMASALSGADRYMALMASLSPSSETGHTEGSSPPISLATVKYGSILNTTQHLIRTRASDTGLMKGGLALTTAGDPVRNGVPLEAPGQHTSNSIHPFAGTTPQRPARNRNRPRGESEADENAIVKTTSNERMRAPSSYPPPLPADAKARYRAPSPAAAALYPPSSPISPTSSSQPGSPDPKRMSILAGPKLRKYSFNAPWEEAEGNGRMESGSNGGDKTGRGEKGVLIVRRKSDSGEAGSAVPGDEDGSKEPVMIWNDVLSGSFLGGSNSGKGVTGRLSDGLFGGSTSTSSVLRGGLGGRFHLRNPFAGGNTSMTTSDSNGSGLPYTPPVTKSKSRRPNTASSTSSAGSKFTLKGMSGLGGATGQETKSKISTGDVGSRRNTMILPGQTIAETDSPVKSLHGEVKHTQTSTRKGMSTGAESFDSMTSMGSLVKDGAYAVYTGDTPFDDDKIARSHSSTSTGNLSAHRYDDPPGTTNSIMSLSNRVKSSPASPTKSKSSAGRLSRFGSSPAKSARAIGPDVIEAQSSEGTALSGDGDQGSITPMTKVPEVVPVRKSPSAQKLVTISTGESEMQLEQAVNMMMGGGFGTIGRGRKSTKQIEAPAGQAELSTGAHSRSQSRSRTTTAGGEVAMTGRRVSGDFAVPQRRTMYETTSPQATMPEQVLVDGPKASLAIPPMRGKPLKPKRSGILRLFGKDTKKAAKGATPAVSLEVEGQFEVVKENSADGVTAPDMPPTAAEMIKQAYQAALDQHAFVSSAARRPSRENLAEMPLRHTAKIHMPAVRSQPSDAMLSTPRRSNPAGGKIVRSNSETSPKKFAPTLGKVRPISMMFPEMQGSPEHVVAGRLKTEALSVPDIHPGEAYLSSDQASSFMSSGGSAVRPRVTRLETKDSFATARSELSNRDDRADDILTVELLQNQLVNARKAWHIQIIELEAQIRELKHGVDEAREEQLKRLNDGSCPQCGCTCKAEEEEVENLREKERLSSETARTAGGGAGGSMLNRGRAKTGGARNMFGTGDLMTWG